MQIRIHNLALALCALSTSALSEPFYQGKSFSVLVNLSAGGPTDTEARLLARHIGKHIAGNPAIVVRNMTGAGGIVAANWLGQVAPNDGLTMGFFSSIPSSSASAIPSLKIDITKLGYVGTGSGVSVTYARKDTGGGIASPDDLASRKEVWVGGLAVDSDKDLRLRLQLEMLGVNIKYVTGYPGAGDIRLALQRGEVQMTSESLPSYRSAVEPALVDKGAVIPIWFDNASEATNPHPHEAQGIAATTYYEYFKRVKGKPPAGELWDAFDTMNTLSRGFERLLVMAPNTPKEALDAVKQALVDLRSDEEFKRDSIAMMKFTPNYDVSAEVEKIFLEKSKPNPAFISFFEKYIESGKTASMKN
jgi:tripartite-type tricarboxylate transporter receptor subunit TctC